MTYIDDATAETRFQALRACGRYDMLLEIPSFEALETRCGELHAKVRDDPHDHRLMALYGAYGSLWEQCRGLTTG